MTQDQLRDAMIRREFVRRYRGTVRLSDVFQPSPFHLADAVAFAREYPTLALAAEWRDQEDGRHTLTPREG